jgi:hypothetical protein
MGGDLLSIRIDDRGPLGRTTTCSSTATLEAGPIPVATPLPPTVLPLDGSANVPSGGDQTVNLA